MSGGVSELLLLYRQTEREREREREAVRGFKKMRWKEMMGSGFCWGFWNFPLTLMPFVGI